MRVSLWGGPLHGTAVTWPSTQLSARFPTAEIVAYDGVPVTDSAGHPAPEPLEIAEYALLPYVGNVWSRRPVARFRGLVG